MTEVFEKQVAELNLDRSDWNLVKFGDVAIQQKQTVDRENTELTRYVKGEHMYSEDIHLREWGELNDEYLGPAFIRKFEEGDVLYGSRRTYLRKVVIAPFEGITSNTTFVVKANEEIIDKRLLPFIMLSEGFSQHSIRNSKGSVNPYVNWKDLAGYEFLLPPKSVQNLMLELLQTTDYVVQKQLVVLDIAKTAKSSTEKYYFKKDNLTPRVAANDFFYKVADGTHDTPKRRSKGYKLITSKNIVNNKLDTNTDYFISEDDYNSVNKRSQVDKNDILFGMIGTVGQVCLVTETPDYAIKNMGLFKSENNNKALVGFYYLRSNFFQNNLLRTISGTTQKYVSLSYLRNIKFPDPSDELVLEWVSNEIAFDQAINDITAQLDSSKKLMKSILNRIF